MRIHRRSLLKGAAAGALALPGLQIFDEGTARAGTAPQRLVIMFAGVSLGRDWWGNPDSKVDIDTKGQPGTGLKGNSIVPKVYGDNFPLTDALGPIGQLSLQKKIAVVSGLELPTDLSKPGAVGTSAWHHQPVGAQLTGVRAKSDSGIDVGFNGVTADQIAVPYLVPMSSSGLDSIHYKVQASDTYNLGRISWRKSGGGHSAREPIIDARQAFNQLATNVTVPDPLKAKQMEDRLTREKSAIDLALAKEARLKSLGKEDQRRLQQHFDELRALKTRLTSPKMACSLPPAPTDDLVSTGGYSHENDRYPILNGLITTAFACDVTRIATMCISIPQSFLSTKYIVSSGAYIDTGDAFNNNTDTGNLHTATHSPFLEQPHVDVVAWHVKIFADLVDRLSKTSDVDGRTLLDNTAVVLVFEGGHGTHPTIGFAGAHSGQNMAMLVAGRAAGNAAGKHIGTNGAHPSSVLLTALKNVGVPAPSLGEISATIPELIA